MFDKASLKLGLDKAVLQSMGANKGEVANTNVSVCIYIQCLSCFLFTNVLYCVVSIVGVWVVPRSNM